MHALKRDCRNRSVIFLHIASPNFDPNFVEEVRNSIFRIQIGEKFLKSIEA